VTRGGWARDDDGACTIAVRVTPRSSRVGVEAGEEVTIRVHAPPEGGRATREAGERLASALSVPRSRIRVRTGERSRRKVFEVSGMSASEARRRLLGSR
jgi:uncharacterized protein